MQQLCSDSYHLRTETLDSLASASQFCEEPSPNSPECSWTAARSIKSTKAFPIVIPIMAT